MDIYMEINREARDGLVKSMNAAADTVLSPFEVGRHENDFPGRRQ